MTLDTTTLWYTTRATGMVVLILLTITVMIGTLTFGRRTWPGVPLFTTRDVHRNIALLAVLLLVVHIVTAVLDPFSRLTWLMVFVPFQGAYRPVYMAAGVVAMELLLVLILTSLSQRWFNARAWRVAHFAAYPCWVLAVVHGTGAGTDAAQDWATGVQIGCGCAVILAIVWRLVLGLRLRSRADA